MGLITPERKVVWGWAFYDWANTAFAVSVMAGFFPIFFKDHWSAAADVNLSTARLGFANSAVSLFLALMAPLVGAIADSGTLRKKFLVFFAYLGALATASLYLVQEGAWVWALLAYCTAIVGFSGGNLFYDALLKDVARDQSVDYVSGFGYALGYLGGGLLFLLNILMTRMPDVFGFASASSAMRFSFLTVALWWAVFTLFPIVWVREETIPGRRRASAILGGIRHLAQTFRKIRRLKNVWLFLAAYWFYIDGVGTIMRMAVDYGLSLGFSSRDLVTALLMVQFIGFPSALGFGKLAGMWGVRRCLFLTIGVYMAIALWATVMRAKYEFYMLAATLGAAILSIILKAAFDRHGQICSRSSRFTYRAFRAGIPCCRLLYT